MDYQQLEENEKSVIQRYPFIRIFCLNSFLSCISFSIAMPSIWSYIEKHTGSELSLAIALLLYSLGELIGSLMVGHLHNTLCTKKCLFIAMSIGLLGNLMYVTADYLPDPWSLGVIFVARLFQGLWTGGEQAVEQSYVSEVVYKKHKLELFNYIGISISVGFLVGPLLGSVISQIELQAGFLVFDEFTNCGYLLVMASLTMINVTRWKFHEIPQHRRVARKYHFKGIQPYPPSKKGLVCCMIACFIVFNGFSVQETVITPLITDTEHRYTNSFDWGLTETYLLYVGGGVLTILVFLAMQKWSEQVSSRVFLLAGLVMGAIGWIVMMDFRNKEIEVAQFVIGFFCVYISFPVSRNVLFTVLSNVIGPNQAGSYFGVMLALGSVSRMLGPFWSVRFLNISVKLCFGIASLFFLVGAALLLACWHDCDCHPQTKNKKAKLLTPENSKHHPRRQPLKHKTFKV